MPTPAHFKLRRKQLLAAIDAPVLLMAGSWIPRNYPANPGPFRADSTFLFFFPNPEPNAAALFDPKDRSVTLFLDERTDADALWHGPSASFAEVKRTTGVDRVEKRSDLAALIKKQLGRRKARTLAIADPRATAEARKITGDKVDFVEVEGGYKLISLRTDVRRLRGRFAGRVEQPVSLQQMDEAIAQSAVARAR